MALFSSLQAFGILCSLIKMKLVAIWLHASGVGLFGIFNSTIDTIATLTDLGLRQSTVRDVAINSSNKKSLSHIATIIRRWSFAGGLLGAVVLSAISIPLSYWFFSTPNFWWQFCIIAAAMLFNSIVNGEQAIMQGAGMLSRLAKSTLAASIAGVVLSIPLFYFLGDTSVVLSIIIYSIAGLVAACYYGYHHTHQHISIKETFSKGSGFAKLGIFMASAAFITNLTHMIFIAWLNSKAQTQTVGLYQAGITLIVKYVGLIFTAIGMEYYPRLAANIFSKKRTEIFVNHEIIILLIVLAPIAIFFLLLREWIVWLLYSPQFMAIIPFITWAILSCVFKGISWCMAYVILARGDGKIYIFTESIDAVIGLSLCMIGYQTFGLEGIGIAYIGWYLIYTLIVGIIYHRHYHLSLSPSTIATAIAITSTIVATILIINHTSSPIQFLILIPAALAFTIPIKRMWKR